MTDKLLPILNGDAQKRLRDMGDGTYAEVIAVVSGSGGTASAKEVLVTSYNVITTFAGGSPGDLVTLTQIFDFSVVPPTVTSIWKNETLGTNLGAAPPNDHLSLLGGAGLTDTQLRATPVPVSATSLPLPTGAASQPQMNTLIGNVGVGTDATASTDTGSFSIIAFIKRSLTNWTSLLARIPVALGQTTMTNSIPVTLASNQSTVPVSVAGTVAVNVTNASVPVVHQDNGLTVAATVLRTSGNSSIANTKYFCAQNVGAAAGAINGQALNPGEKIEFRAPDGYQLPLFIWGTGGATTFLLTYIQ